jgi:hypothetical protein
LPDATTQLLGVAAAFTGGIDFEVARRVAGLEERAALDALDAALAAQLLIAAGGQDAAYDFTHALVRHTLYEGLSPARQARLHREIAEAMEAVYGARASEHAAEIARHYSQSAALPGAERAASLEEVADALAMALALVPTDDPRRGRLLARRGLVLGSTKRADEAASIAIEAAELVAVSEGRAAAAEYLAEIANTILVAGRAQAAWAVARHGLTFAGDRHDLAWAFLRAHDLDRLDAEDPAHPGILVDTPERLEVAREIAKFSEAVERSPGPTQSSRPIVWWTKWNIFESRRAALETAAPKRPTVLVNWAGAYRDALPLVARQADTALARGELASAAQGLATCSRLHAVLGDLAAAERDLVRVAELADRSGNPPYVASMRQLALFDVAYARGLGLELGAAIVDEVLARDDPQMRYLRANTHALAAILFTFAGRDRDALRAVALATPAVERAGGGVIGYTVLICRCCEAIWWLGRADFADVLERNLRAKTLAGDFREPGGDARLAMARLCALTGRPGGRTSGSSARAPSSMNRVRARCARSSTTTRR